VVRARHRSLINVATTPGNWGYARPHGIREAMGAEFDLLGEDPLVPLSSLAVSLLLLPFLFSSRCSLNLIPPLRVSALSARLIACGDRRCEVPPLDQWGPHTFVRLMIAYLVSAV
jgi:hypothetical protein